MRNLIHIFWGLLAVTTLSGCGSSDNAESKQLSVISPAAGGGPLLPLPGEVAVRDPDDGQFMDSISEWLTKTGAPANSQYQFTRIDLDGDGRREGMVLMQSPYQEWCIEYGCTMFIFQAHEEGFSYLSEVSPVRGPLMVMDSKTNGWRDIVANVAGRAGWAAKNVALRYDGRGYPEAPALQQAVAMNVLDGNGVKIFP